jgi:hypothetical protein
MNLQEKIQRIREMMALLTEEDNNNEPSTKGVNHGVVIKQPYQKNQEGKQLDSYIIGVTHFDEKSPVYLELGDINPNIVDEIKKVAQNCGFYYEGVGGPDLINIKRFFEKELGLSNVSNNGSYEPKIENENTDKKYFMYTFFSNGNVVDEKTGQPMDGINQDKILLDELSNLEDVKTIYDLIIKGNGSKLFWDNSLDFDENDKKWFIQQILKTPNTENMKLLLKSKPTSQNIRKFIQTGFDIMWGNFDSKKDNFGYQEGKNLLSNMAEIATKKRREYIKNNLVCGIYFIGEGHIKSWQEQFVDTQLIKP